MGSNTELITPSGNHSAIDPPPTRRLYGSTPAFVFSGPRNPADAPGGADPPHLSGHLQLLVKRSASGHDLGGKGWTSGVASDDASIVAVGLPVWGADGRRGSRR